MKKPLIFITVVLLQTIFLMGMVYQKQNILNTGKSIILQVEPRDPRDLFRGDYVTLNYDISVLDRSLFNDSVTSEYANLKPVYVVLEERSMSWGVKEVLSEKPLEGDFIKGFAQNDWSSAERDVWMKYGLDTFFVEEGTGTDWEDKARTGNLYVKVKIDNEGNAIIEKLLTKEELE